MSTSQQIEWKFFLFVFLFFNKLNYFIILVVVFPKLAYRSYNNNYNIIAVLVITWQAGCQEMRDWNKGCFNRYCIEWCKKWLPLSKILIIKLQCDYKVKYSLVKTKTGVEYDLSFTEYKSFEYWIKIVSTSRSSSL